jgi:predicted nuclease of predicted toxin-antitoxin system
MRFLADESCDFRVVRALRAAGHDVVAVPEVATGTEDSAVIEMAVHEARIFVTEDRDFGQLVYAAAKPTRGVILLRFPSNARKPSSHRGGARGRARREARRTFRCSAAGANSVRSCSESMTALIALLPWLRIVEMLFEGSRPILLNSIEDVISRPDLATARYF